MALKKDAIARFTDTGPARSKTRIREADLAQIAQKSLHAEVVGIVDGGFGTQARTAPARFVILLEVRVLIIDVQRRDDPLSLRCAWLTMAVA
jgi:hypothetical protein